MWALLGIALAGPPVFPQGVEPGTIILQLHDPKSNLSGPPELRLAALPDAVFHPLDDGKGVDPHAGDRVFSAALSGWDGEATTFKLSDGKRSWTARGKHEGGTWIWVRLHNERTLQVGDGAPPEAAEGSGGGPVGLLGPSTGSRTEVPSGSNPLGPVSTTVWVVTAGIWGLALSSLLGALGLGIARLGQAPVRPAVVRSEREPPPPVPLRRLRPEELGAALEALGERRLLVVGRVEGTPLPSSLQVFEVEPGALPAELLAAATELALREGPPLALLVLDRSALDREEGPDALASLERRLAGRFPVLVLDAAGAAA